MCRLSIAVIVASSTITFAQIATAAERTLAAGTTSWTGCYIGGNIGHGWGTDAGAGWSSFSDPGNAYLLGLFFALGGNVLPNVRPDGAIVGGQIGCDQQFSPNWVMGFVADLQATNMSDSASATVSLASGGLISFQQQSRTAPKSRGWALCGEGSELPPPIIF